MATSMIGIRRLVRWLFTRTGDWTTAKKLLRYMVTMPQTDGNISDVPQFINAIEDLAASSGDIAFLKEVYPTLKRQFMWLHRFADGETGLMPSPNSCGADDPGEIGIKGMVWPSCINGWWYNAVRAMENFAYRMNDRELADLANALGRKIAANYLPVFYDPKVGYLYAVVDPKTVVA